MAPNPLPSALAVLESLASRGACVTMPGPGRLAVCPPGTASAADLEALRAGRAWIIAAWQAAADWDAEHPPRPAADPLPPGPGANADDAAAWADVLALAAAVDGAEPFGLTGRLRFVRSMGARLRPSPAGGLALRMPAGSPDAAAVAEALEGQGEALRHVLAVVADGNAAAHQRAA